MRYCGVPSCPFFRGCDDPSIQFFRSPTNRELLAKWREATNRLADSKFSICSLHFRDEDFSPSGFLSNSSIRVRRLKSGAIPIPVLVPKTEPNDPLMDNIVKIDIDAIKRSSEEETCGSCLNYAVQLEEARAEIVQLKNKLSVIKNRLSELLEKKRVAKNQKASQLGQKCTLCQAKLTPSHLCVDEENIACPLCSQTFETTLNFLNHIEFHHAEVTDVIDNSSLFKCNQCAVGYPMKILLECHRKAHDNASLQAKELHQSEIPGHSSKSESEQPGMLFESNELVEIDDTASNDSSVLSVFLVSVGTDDEESLGGKLPLATENASSEEVQLNEISDGISVSSESDSATIKLFKCGKCDKAFNTPKQLNCHVLERKCNRCEVCELKLTPAQLESHLCGNEKSIRCDYCTIEFTMTSKLVDHLAKSHETNLKFYHCEKCPKYFSMAALTAFHMDSHARDVLNPFVCEICSKSFTESKYLYYHSKTHSAKNSCLCEECGKCFATKRNVELHRLTHDPSRKPTLQCPDCPKKCLNVSLLKRHAQTHLEHNLVCSICQAVLKSISGYRKHMKIHQRTEADRKYACKLCPRKFFNSVALRNHRKVHTGVRDLHCRFCSQSYKYSGDLHKHLRTHIGDEIHGCSKCPKRFKYPRELKKHESEHYKEEQRPNQTMA